MLRGQGLSRVLGGRSLWRNLSVELEAGECLSIRGPAGAGKTQLLRCLALLDPLQQGELQLLGRAPSAWGIPIWRSRVIYLAQRPVPFPGSVERNLREVFRWASHRGRRWCRQRLVSWLDQLGRDPSFLALEASRLSGGEAQLLALLRALQLDPDVLLLDEPTASLDAVSTERLEGLLRRWLRQGQRGCVLVSHDDAQRRRLSRRQMELRR